MSEPSMISGMLNGRVALVTGAAGGIGSAIAKGLAAHGAAVAAADRSVEEVQATADAIRQAGGKALACGFDVSDAADCRAAAERVRAELGAVSLVVNCAGVIAYAAMEDPAVDEAWTRILKINLSGPFNVVRAFLDQLKTRADSTVVNIGSIAGFIYTSNTVAYSASKGGVHALTVALAKELGKDGIRVNAIAPGAIATTMSPSASDETKLANLLKRVPLGRIGQPADLVGPVVFLSSSMSSYVTGTTLIADGGYLTN